MGYPPAPWTLRGHAIQTLQAVDAEQARLQVPPELQIISVWPGKTGGGVYLGAYGSGSALVYNELIVVAALVNYLGRVGCWISHIYVDNPDSVAGGREIWGLPKELARFTWQGSEQRRVTVRQADRQLCTLHYNPQPWGWRQQFAVPSFSTLGSHLLFFTGNVESRVGITRARLEVPEESPFAALGFGRPWLTLSCDALSMVANAPQVVGRDRSQRPADVGQ